jgi:FkbM family methyltransferase
MRGTIRKFQNRIGDKVITWGRKFPEGRIKRFAKKVYQEYGDRESIKAVQSLPIAKSGSSEGMGYIILDSGETFYGFRSGSGSLQRYQKLDESTKETLEPEAYFTAEQYYFYHIDPPWDRQRYYTISEGDTVIDVGSNQGFYTRKLSSLVGESGQVLAIEPHPDNYKVLVANSEESEYDNITVVNKAVSDSKGDINLYERGTQSGRHHIVEEDEFEDVGEEITIQSDTVDSVVRQQNLSDPDFVSLTINRHEYQGLKGMEKIMESSVHIGCPMLDNLEESKDLLSEREYDYHVVREYDISPILYSYPQE